MGYCGSAMHWLPCSATLRRSPHPGSCRQSAKPDRAGKYWARRRLIQSQPRGSLTGSSITGNDSWGSPIFMSFLLMNLGAPMANPFWDGRGYNRPICGLYCHIQALHEKDGMRLIEALAPPGPAGFCPAGHKTPARNSASVVRQWRCATPASRADSAANCG